MMKFALKIMVTFMCLYVFITKTYVVIYYFIRHKNDFPLLFADLIVLCACILLVLFIWRKNKKIKCTVVWNPLLMGSVIIQIYSGLFNFLTKSQMVDQNKVLWIYDIPYLLSFFILLITLIKMRDHRIDSSQ